MISFTMRSHGSGSSGLRDEGLSHDAHWALNGYQSPEPEDGPCVEPPPCRYRPGDIAQANRSALGFASSYGTNTVGVDEVPLSTVLAMALRRGALVSGPDPRCGVCNAYTMTQEQAANQRPGWACLAAEVQCAIWERAEAK